MGAKDNTESLLLPPSRARLWIGLAVGVLGPLVIFPVVRSGSLSLFPGVPFVLIVVLAAVFGRLLAGSVATAVSVVLLDRYLVDHLGAVGIRTEQDIWAVLVFAAVAVIVSSLVARLDRTIDAETRERDRLVFLSRAGDALSRSIDINRTLRGLSEVLVPALADWFSVDLLEGDRIENVLVVHPDPTKVELALELQRRFPSDPDAPTGVPNVIRTGRSELIASITDEMLQSLIEDADLLETMRGLHLRCAMTVPLTARGRTFGALTLIGAESHERYGPADLQVAEEIADRAALAIDTARLFAAETEARADALKEARRNEILKDVTAAFGRALTVEEVMAALLGSGIRTAGAVAGTVGIVVGNSVELLGVSGYQPDDDRYWHTFDLDEQLPMAEAIVTRKPVVVTSTAERDSRYPLLRGRGEQRDHVLVCLPLLLGDVAVGGFSASYPPDTSFGPDDLAFLGALGEQCAQAIDRARAREGAIKTQSRFDALAKVSRELAFTLDFAVTAETVARLAFEYLGERTGLYEATRDGSRLVAQADPSGVRSVTEPDLQQPEDDLVKAIERALGQGGPLVVDEYGEPSPGGGSAGLVLPLSIASSTFGALVVGHPRLDLTEDADIQFATEAARRMSRALENARLYREKAYVARTLQESLLPPVLPEVPGVDIDAVFLPAVQTYEVGGDFYDVFQTDDGHWAAVVGDVCGKGVEAAALTGLARHTLRALAIGDEPSEALSMLNRALLRERLDGRFCTVAYTTIEMLPEGGARLVVALGGHPAPQRVLPDGSSHAVGLPGTLLGVTDPVEIHDVEVRLAPDEALMMFTDGILQKDETAGEPHGLIEMFKQHPPVSASAICEEARRYVQGSMANEQYDDVAVLVIRAR